MKSKTGILFIGPIIGTTPSLRQALSALGRVSTSIEIIDIFENQDISKTPWHILRLTVLPGSNSQRIHLANHLNEDVLFKNIVRRIEKLKESGVKNIILGGMSGGFIFASRVVQQPSPINKKYGFAQYTPLIKGLFGVSPLVFYPPGVEQDGAEIDLIPKNIKVLLIWGDRDTVIPHDTINYCLRHKENFPHIKIRLIQGSEVGQKNHTVRHQFFGGKDFIYPLKNFRWNKKAETIALQEIMAMINAIK